MSGHCCGCTCPIAPPAPTDMPQCDYVLRIANNGTTTWHQRCTGIPHDHTMRHRPGSWVEQ